MPRKKKTIVDIPPPKMRSPYRKRRQKKKGEKQNILKLRPEEVKFADLIMEGYSIKEAFGMVDGLCQTDEPRMDGAPYYYAKKVGPYIRRVQEVLLQESLKGLIATQEEVLSRTTYELREALDPTIRLQAARMLQSHHEKVKDSLKTTPENERERDQIIVMLPPKKTEE